MNRYIKYISAPALYALGLTGVLVLFSELWRLLLLIFSRELAAPVPAGVLLEAFLVGIRFDFKVISVVVLIVFVAGTIPLIDISRCRMARMVNFFLLGLLAAVMFFIHLVDIEFFGFFNARLNGSALLWNDTSGDVLSMVWSSFPVIRYLLLYAAILTLFLFIIRRLLNGVLALTGETGLWVNLIYIPGILAVLVLGSIGRIYEVAPMRWGMAYFSQYDFANQLALNPAYTFVRDILHDANQREHLRELVDLITAPGAEQMVRDMLDAPPDHPDIPIRRMKREVRIVDPPEIPPNVILIVMESYGASRINCLKSEYPYNLTPGFDYIAGKGILFTNFYSSGTHTCIGLFSTLCGTPHLFGKTMIKQVRGYTTYWSLPDILREKGYRTLFYTTQDPHYDNMQGFLRANGMTDISSVFDYDDSLVMSWLGVPDHVMFDRAYDELRRLAVAGGRFFATLLSSSHHGPYTFPDVPIEYIPASEKESAELNALKYSDWSLVRFFKRIEQDSAFANTLIFVTSDNGIKYRPTSELDISMIQIPFYVYNTDWNLEHGIKSDRIGCQLDILPTVMGMLKLDYDNYSFGVDLLDSTSLVEDFAFSTSWYNVAFIQDSVCFMMRLGTDYEILFHLSDKTTNIAAQYPELTAEMRRKAGAIYESAFYNQQLPLRHRHSYGSIAREKP
ncbi:MAG: sulfatase-like hydrolase/transferase [Candidatus Zixiibacteriota bacterium]|nr:MAG: sulfatase-like hydrolase/transferase [candidate division Zixibacteria bacterium]